jgi:DedD protein
MPERAVEPAVDELRRKARRRLVGAIVLALAAAVIVPMLLESDPKPLGEDVSIRIPPVDEGKFVNRLSPAAPAESGAREKSPKSAATPATAPSTGAADRPATSAKGQAGAATPAEPVGEAPAKDTAPPARRSLTEAEQRVLAPGAKAPTATAQAPSSSSLAPAAAPSAPAPESVSADAAGAAVPAPTAAPASAAKSATGGEGKPAEVAADGAKTYAVQLAAFADDKGATALAGRLKRAGWQAYTEPLSTSRGTLWRVRVGPFADREAADAARNKLKAEGQNGIVAPSR